MTREEYIASIVSQIEDGAARQEVERELQCHIDDRVAYYTDAGYDEHYALNRAMEKMGEPEAVGIQMNTLHDHTDANKALKVFTVMHCIFMLLMPLTQLLSLELVLGVGSVMLRLAVPATALWFYLASRLSNYRCLLAVSVFNLGSGIAFTANTEFDYTVYSLLNLFAKRMVFGLDIDTVAAWVTRCGFGYLLLIGLIGIFYAFHLRTVLSGEAKTSISRRYRKFNYLGLAASVMVLAYYAMVVFTIGG